MQNIILYDSAHTQDLWPLTATRPVGELRIGILTIREKWEKRWNAKVSYKTADYLQKKFPLTIEEDNFLIDASILPNEELNYLLTCLNTNQFISHESRFVAARLNRRQVESFFQVGGTITDNALELINCKRVQHLWEIFGFNDLELKNDYEILTKDKNSIALHASNQHFGTQLFIEDGAKIKASILNSETGPIYISKNTEIMEGAMIRGPFYLGENAQVKMGAKIYGATTIGPGCRVGGEINNSVFYANSNKAHDGFIGNAVIGEWCNIGADSNNSNLKNNYDIVKIWNYPTQRFIPTGSIFCGLMMGDHAKCGINTMFNTGTVVGVGANVFGDGFPRQFIPDFAWGGNSGFTTFKLDKFYETAKTVMLRRNQELNEFDRDILKHIYDTSAVNRSWEKSMN